ncbi:alpha/beta hydrolase family protein [Streptomyces sp. NPDC093225]|uniref:alpha/beta hydrolase family protein n=1 Tax=Streptomyces sp. NPDC093225 TaxID=3366034 RepID=UPI003813DC86
MVTFSKAAPAAVLALTLSLPLVTAGAAAAAGPPGTPSAATAPRSDARVLDRPELPRPTGPFAVGSSALHLVDRSRPDPWVPEADGRELMVTIHYPAARRAAGEPAPYATAEEARLLVEGAGFGGAVPPAELRAMRTYARVDARPAGGRHPLVVLSPGFTVSRYTLTALAEDLASRGYVVASVDHAYESYGIEVPGGRVLTCVACGEVLEGRAPASKVTAGRARDVSFVLDRLIGRHATDRFARMIDARRVGMAGHSIGGASTMTAMTGDRRIRAGVNMDGAFHDAVPAQGLGGRPFMMLGTGDEVHQPGGEDRTWDTTWRALDGWKRWITFTGADHYSFTDGPVIAEHFGLPRTPLPADRALPLTRAYVAAFFDRHLRGTPQPLLDAPSPTNPEVSFHTP